MGKTELLIYNKKQDCIREPLKISAEARGESEGIVAYVELFAWR